MSNHNNPGQAPDTGHEWDGIRELTNAPPKWWTICFYLSLLWCVVYFILYPSIPLINGPNEGLLNWSSIKEYKQAVAKYQEIREPYMDQLETMSAEQILADQEMLNFANSYTNALFGDYCSACHGAGGQGVEGRFPNLRDDNWLYGGSVDAIKETITNGREGMMPAFQADLGQAEIEQLADFVIALPQGQATQAGWSLYEESGCGLCHGEDAKGVPDFGSANLTDSVWRFGDSRDEVIRTISKGVNQEDVEGSRSAVMPAFDERLSDNDIKLLTVRVWSFGGGQQ
ncbi:cytochrome C oxidase subunit III [Candidatus Tenderia electrophaga]|jgi:cytochrome c oxidase cbb3-type subunit 3|uniref:Cbb3-type cytochrome c oxidase subunit n=1 Tax=Candidatus Tenderia electrophaga TaxID=1748243 RepID=A0A0S2TCX9_9GAMM|nr:cytochrome C oxidase subunit III [Candidatus Tenderia electrophaga]